MDIGIPDNLAKVASQRVAALCESRQWAGRCPLLEILQDASLGASIVDSTIRLSIGRSSIFD